MKLSYAINCNVGNISYENDSPGSFSIIQWGNSLLFQKNKIKCKVKCKAMYFGKRGTIKFNTQPLYPWTRHFFWHPSCCLLILKISWCCC